ncbi:MAG: phosphatase PAP2 family protein [Trinickia sp.]|uniref:phosphatase PAP2 family protein n=1 Tax=Trinickia sp. TaxID=2571163 RepID=UPI003F823B66
MRRPTSHPQDSPSSYWRSYVIGWTIIVALLVVDALWLRAGAYSVRLTSLAATEKPDIALLLIAAGLGAMTRVTRYRTAIKTLRSAELSQTLAYVAMLSCFASACSILSYLCVTTNAPLIDNDLIQFDRLLGFDWSSTYQWVRAHPDIHRALALAYDSGLWQLIGIPVLLGLMGRRRQLAEFSLLFMSAAVLTSLVPAVVPAASAFTHFGITDPQTASTVSDFALLRSGSLRTFDLSAAQGLVSMPSFHTEMAVIFAYALRRVPVVSVIGVVLNAAMIASTPSQGGHYLADVIGGLLLALALIGVARSMRRRRTPQLAAVVRASSSSRTGEPVACRFGFVSTNERSAHPAGPFTPEAPPCGTCAGSEP